jgi:serine/threonine protein kinase
VNLDRLRHARFPEDIFGDLPNDITEAYDIARAIYRDLARRAHPDAGGSNELMAKLNALWERAQRDIGSHVYGRGLVVKTRSGEIRIGDLYAHGDICNLYLGADNTLVKMPRRPVDSSHLLNEAKVLRRLREDPDYERWWSYVPEIKKSYRHRSPDGKVRQVNVLERLDGFYTLEEVAHAYPAGIAGRDMAWMWRRVLVALGFVHRHGIIHGAITPEHVLIHPAMHGVVLVDWTLAGKPGERLKARIGKWRDLYPSETTLSERLDIHMASLTMATVLSDRMTPSPIHAFMKGCRVSRLPSAWKLKEEFDELLEKLYGPRTYRPFRMPVNT